MKNTVAVGKEKYILNGKGGGASDILPPMPEAPAACFLSRFPRKIFE
jgi:hypothetical protein